MNLLIPIFLTISFIILSCGETGETRQGPTIGKQTDEDLSIAKAVDVWFTLPDREDNKKDSSLLGDKVNSFQVWYKSDGKCSKVENSYFSGWYSDNEKITLSMQDDCDYIFNVSVGWSDETEKKSSTKSNLKNSSTKSFRDFDLTAENPTYDDEIEPFITKYCVKCHGSSGNNYGVDLSDYEKAKKAAQSSYNSMVRANNPMPEKNPSSVSKEQKDLFKLWVDQGAIEKAVDDSGGDKPGDDKPGNGDAVVKTTLLKKSFFSTDSLEILSKNLKNKDSIEITNIDLKITKEGETEGFESDSL